MAEHNQTGHSGEDIAADFMRSKGYTVLDRNWRMGHLEMDVICASSTEVVFVEVKTRTTEYGGKAPEQYVDAEKQRFMVVAANAYIRYHQILDKTIRFDVIGILMEHGTMKEIHHYENAFYPRMRTVPSSSPSGIRRNSRAPYRGYHSGGRR